MAMLVAVSRSRPRSVAKIIKGRSLDVDGCDVPALWVACYNGGLTLTLTLITPSTNLTLTLTNPDVNMAQMLIKDYKAQINRFCVTTQSSSLMTASRRGHLKCVLLLLEHGVDVNLTCKPRHFTALMLAAVEGHVEVCRVLLSAGAFYDVSTSKGHLTALMLAATRGHNAVVRLLLGSMDKKGVTASSDATSATGSTAFMFSCKYGQKDCATTLLKHNADICTVSKLGESGLLFALRNKWLNIAKHIIRKGGAANTAVCRSIEYRGQNPLLVAMHFDLKSAAEMLLADHNVTCITNTNLNPNPNPKPNSNPNPNPNPKFNPNSNLIDRWILTILCLMGSPRSRLLASRAGKTSRDSASIEVPASTHGLTGATALSTRLPNTNWWLLWRCCLTRELRCPQLSRRRPCRG